MKSLSEFKNPNVRVLLTDIDGTLTEHGRLPPHAYSALCQLAERGIHVIPVTGRPAGWCELIARLWPVHGVVGENGAFYYRYDGKMKRVFAREEGKRKEDAAKLEEIRNEVLATVKGSAIASDQFCRMFDLAVDFSEDVPPLAPSAIQQIVKIFKKHGAQAKVSNIHVNGWFGDYDKVTMCKKYLFKEFGYSEGQMRSECAFVGDSPNDEPMFEFFPHSFAVANIQTFIDDLKHKPAYIAAHEEGKGFCEVAEQLLALQSR